MRAAVTEFVHPLAAPETADLVPQVTPRSGRGDHETNRSEGEAKEQALGLAPTPAPVHVADAVGAAPPHKAHSNENNQHLHDAIVGTEPTKP